MVKQAREIIEVDDQRLEELLDRAASNTLRVEDTELLRKIFQSYTGFFRVVEDKNTTLARLRKLLFGSTSEKAEDILGKRDETPPAATADDASDTEQEEQRDPPKVGHGRRSAEEYPGADRIAVDHPSLKAGDTCPACGKGTIYEQAPGVLVRFVGRSPIGATVYRLEKFRCHLCGKIFTAPVPPGIADDKYDHTAASMIGLMKYGSGLPFNRLERLQRNCEIPLPASTQWEIAQAASKLLQPAYEELIRQAAQGEVLHNDDTNVRILELMGKRMAKRPLADEEDSTRTGLFTSGIVATLAGIRIALFFSGRSHAGENLSEVLKHRVKELSAPIQMSDGLSRNLPKALATIVANCLTHARRKFVDVVDRFPEECAYVIEALKVVYRNDRVARKRKLRPDQRLAYHQQHSQSTMDQLKAWLEAQFADKRVEPNSALGEAISYMLKRWAPLTLFLRQPGAPLDNNICERALKKAIIHRKNSLFYRSSAGSMVGDMYMSLIHTCELNGTDALDYLNELQLNAASVESTPGDWMPWNYKEHLLALPTESTASCDPA